MRKASFNRQTKTALSPITTSNSRPVSPPPVPNLDLLDTQYKGSKSVRLTKTVAVNFVNAMKLKEQIAKREMRQTNVADVYVTCD